MKVSFGGKVRKVNTWPESLAEFRTKVARKFTERSLIDDSVNITANQVKKRTQLIDWDSVTLFYEDSEGDLNVISEEEDLADAQTYALMKAP